MLCSRTHEPDLIDIPDLTEEEMAYAMDDFFGHRWMEEYLTLGGAWDTALYRDGERLARIAQDLVRERDDVNFDGGWFRSPPVVECRERKRASRSRLQNLPEEITDGLLRFIAELARKVC